MNIKLLVLDIDGTIAGKSNQVSDRVVEAIEAVQQSGIKVAVATGRMYHSAWRFHQRIKSSLPISAYNGAWIQDPLDGKRHHHWPVPSDLALELLDFLEQPQFRQQIDIHCYMDDKLLVREITEETEEYKERSGIFPKAVGDFRNILDEPTTKVLVISSEIMLIQQLLESLKKQYNSDQLCLTQSNPTYLEITHPQANKGTAVCYIAEKLLGLSADQVMTIGDNFNDLRMLEYAGMGIAMGNAPLEVQKSAQWVTKDVEEDGVAVAIEKFLL
ncbi:MAG: Cof-type HAD-IIB family hydrolase [Microcystaceae cyanobacterium]